VQQHESFYQKQKHQSSERNHLSGEPKRHQTETFHREGFFHLPLSFICFIYPFAQLMKVAKSVPVAIIYCLGLLCIGALALNEREVSMGNDRAIITITSTTTAAATTVAITQSTTNSPTVTQVPSAASINVYDYLRLPLYLAFAILLQM
jgi:hypothetical protein